MRDGRRRVGVFVGVRESERRGGAAERGRRRGIVEGRVRPSVGGGEGV